MNFKEQQNCIIFIIIYKNITQFSTFLNQNQIIILHKTQETVYSAMLTQNYDFSSQKLLFFLKSALLGAGRAFISLPFQYPFDTIKTTMQSKQSTTSNAISHIRESKGWKGFYSGFTINSVRVISKQMYRWPLWLSFTAFYNDLLKINSEIWKQSMIGLSLSVAQLLILCPFERLKIWLMTANNQKQTTIKNYFRYQKSFFELYSGFTPLLIRQAFSWISFLYCSESFKNLYKEYKGQKTLTHKDLLLISLPVSLVNTLLIMPADCIKTFYQEFASDKRGWSLWKLTKETVNKYGIKGLYSGWSVRIVQYTINSMFTLILFEQLMKEYRSLRQ